MRVIRLKRTRGDRVPVCVRARVLQIRNREITVADIQRQLFAQRERHAGHALVGKTRVITIERLHDRALGPGMRVHIRAADTGADIGLDAAALIEVEERVQHRRPNVHVTRGE